MTSKILLSFALVVTGTFFKFLACICRLRFTRVKGAQKLHSPLSVVTGTFSEFLAWIIVISFFAGEIWSLNLQSPLHTSLQVPILNT